MGGPGSGGRRVGAGRKRQDNVVAFMHGSRQRAGQAPAQSPVVKPVECPMETADPERAVWVRYVPEALAAGTLTKDNALTFVDLVCHPHVVYARVLAELERDGLTQWVETKEDKVLKKHPLWPDLNNWHKRIEAGHVKFGMSPFGKPCSLAEAPKALSPFEALQAQAAAIRGKR